jgi:metallo-beta-lactamase family protein
VSKRTLSVLLVLAFVLGVPFSRAGGGEPPYLKFCGANGTIFGSCHLLSTGKSTVLIDAGLFQEEDSQEGDFQNEDVNRQNRFLAFNPATIDAIFVTHAHADHIGKIPYLVKNGFRGKIYCTEATAQLAKEMLNLYAWILSKESPLYDQVHVASTLSLLVPCQYGRVYTRPDGLEFRFLDAGHILGSAMVEIRFTEDDETHLLLFTGDIGNPYSPLLRPQETVEEADYVICESTYGNRAHGEIAEDLNRFRDIVNSSVKAGGKVLIPSYILSRTQKILFFLNDMIEGRLFDQGFDVYVDSKYADIVTRLYRQNSRLFDAETQAAMRMRDLPLSFPGLKESKPPDPLSGPAVIIAPGGMATTGNIRKHLVKYLPDPRSAVIFVGYQADGSLGKSLLDGAQTVEIDGRRVPVKASSYYLSSFSDHADYLQITAWLKKFRRLGTVFLVHGQPDALRDFKKHIEAQTGISTYVPHFLEKITLKGRPVSPSKSRGTSTPVL